MDENKMNKNRKTKIKKYLTIIGTTLLVIIGLLLVFNGPLQNMQAKNNQNRALSGLTAAQINKNKKKKGDFNYKHVKSLNPYQLYKSRYQNPATIGVMAIPAIGMRLPIEKGLSDINMSSGGCTMRPNQKMGKGNYPLAGHYMTNYGALFSPLERAQIGNEVYISNLKKIYVYKIYSKKIVPPTAVYLVKNTKKPIITLITCADGGKNRWSLRGKLTGYAPATKKNLKIFGL